MPTSQKIDIKKLGIIAGGGSLPRQLSDSCTSQGIEPIIVGFHGHTESKTLENHTHIQVSLGCAGKVIGFFHDHDVTDLVMIGHIKRPSFTELKPDFKAIQILSRIGFKALGDNSLLSALKRELENEGFTLHGIQKFCQDLLIGSGVLGRYSPNAKQAHDIDYGIQVSQEIGALDIGQSVIIQDGVVIGVEAAEGTDELIKRCKHIQKKGNGGILVKTCKPQQDKDLDMPTIGIQTIKNAHESGLSGIAVHANNVIIIDPDAVTEYANKHKLFIIGVNI